MSPELRSSVAVAVVADGEARLLLLDLPSADATSLDDLHDRARTAAHALGLIDCDDAALTIVGTSVHTGLEADLLGRMATWYATFQQLRRQATG